MDCFQNDAGITRKYLADRIDRKVFFPATNDEPLASLLYLNFISSEETIKFLQTGKEGVTYKMTDNGAYEMLNATGEWIMNSGMNIDHTITVNIIHDGKLVEKRGLKLPERIRGVLKCKNPRCITSVEQELPQEFLLTDPAKRVYRCIYCETEAGK